ncbi:MAG: 60S ribosomal protein L31 [Nanoarchaeota archaeon]|nr:60S ribosomal protein L31 [Nanoarchaeota archaeon]
MAKEKKKEKEKKIVLERVYNVPLRKEFLKSPRYKRSKKAITALRKFLVRHMKSDKVKIGKYANLNIWKDGIKKPPHHIKVVAKKDEEGNVFAELEGAPVEKPVETEKKKVGKEKAEKKETGKEEKKIEEGFKKLEEKTEKIIEKKAEKGKEIQKEEIKELKKEHPKQHAPKEAVKPKNIEAKPTAPQGRTDMRKP